MDRQELNQTLQQLHRELQQIKVEDVSLTDKLQPLMTDVQALLDQKEDAPTHQYSRLAEQLSDIIRHIEVSHPTATGVMGRTIKMLARMGI